MKKGEEREETFVAEKRQCGSLEPTAPAYLVFWLTYVLGDGKTRAEATKQFKGAAAAAAAAAAM